MVDGIVMLGAGLLVSYYGSYGPPFGGDAATTAKWQQWHRQWGRWLKWSGAVLTLLGAASVLLGLL